MASVLGQFIPTPRVPQAYTSGPVTALRVQNGSAYTLRVVLGGQLFDKIAAGADQTYNVANLGGFGGWVLLIPGGSPTPNTSLNAPGGALSGPVTVTSYGSNDAIPYGTATQQSEARFAPYLAGPDEIFDSLNGHIAFRLRLFGVVADGVSDDSAAIQACENAANICGGGEILWPSGTIIAKNLTKASHVRWRGMGNGITILKLPPAANMDLVGALQSSINLSGTLGTGPSTAINGFSIENMTLDGNCGNQTSGPCYPLRFYGYGYTLQDLEVRNGWSGGILCDYYGPFPSTGNTPANEGSNNHRFESTWINVRSHTNLGATTAIGIEMGGPHDSRFTNVLSYINNSHSLHSGPNNGGLQLNACHFWQSGTADANSCTALMESSFYAVGSEAEGSPYAQLVILANSCTWYGGSVYAGGAAGLGIQIGQTAGNTPYTNSTKQSAGLTTLVAASSNVIDTLIQNITHASGGLYLADDAGNMFTYRMLAAATGNVQRTGTLATKSTLMANYQGYTAGATQQEFIMGGTTIHTNT